MEETIFHVPIWNTSQKNRLSMNFHRPLANFNTWVLESSYFGSPDLTPPGLQKVSINPHPGDIHESVGILMYS